MFIVLLCVLSLSCSGLAVSTCRLAKKTPLSKSVATQDYLFKDQVEEWLNILLFVCPLPTPYLILTNVIGIFLFVILIIIPFTHCCNLYVSNVDASLVMYNCYCVCIPWRI